MFKKQQFNTLWQCYKNDYFDNELPIYTINRHIEELNTNFKDGFHIVEIVLQKVNEKYGITKTEAEKLYNAYAEQKV